MADIRDHDFNVTVVARSKEAAATTPREPCEGTTLLLCSRNGSRGNNLLGQAIFFGRVFLNSLQGPARRKVVRHEFEKSGNGLVNFV